MDPITITIVGALIKGAVNYAQEEHKKERIRMEREEEIKKELMHVGGQVVLTLLDAGLKVLEKRTDSTRQITVRSESRQ